MEYMKSLALHELHQNLNAVFGELNGAEIVPHYGDVLAEHDALRQTAGVLDLSFRSRICLTGADRVRFLHGQVTNDIKRLRAGEGCYAALVTAKGKMESDFNVYCLQDELLLDFEPGLTDKITQRLEKFIVADDVQVVDVALLYGLLSLQGPKAEAIIRSLGVFSEIPTRPFRSIKVSDATLGEIYLITQPRFVPVTAGSLPAAEPGVSPGGMHATTSPVSEESNTNPRGQMLPSTAGGTPAATASGFDLFVPLDSLGAVADKLIAAAKPVGGGACGWEALEIARIESGIPRFSADMDETNIPLESGIESRAVSYDKGCYIGQEVINRIHSIGHVNKELRGLRLADDLKILPSKGDKLFRDGKEVGYITSAAKSPVLNANIALACVRRGANAPGTDLVLQTATGETKAVIAELPFI